MSEAAPHEIEKRNRLIEIIEKFRSVMMITLCDGKSMGLRPMYVVEAPQPGIVWFVASRDSTKVEDISRTGVVYLTGQDGSSLFFAAKGHAEIFTDEGTKLQFWREPLRVWFPRGETDPALCFIKVAIVEGEYWDTTGIQKVSYFIDAVKAYVTGTTPSIDNVVQHGTVHA